MNDTRLSVVFPNKDSKDWVKDKLTILGDALEVSPSAIAQMFILDGIVKILDNQEEASQAMKNERFFALSQNRMKFLKECYLENK